MGRALGGSEVRNDVRNAKSVTHIARRLTIRTSLALREIEGPNAKRFTHYKRGVVMGRSLGGSEVRMSRSIK